MQHHLIDGIGATPGKLEPGTDLLAQGRPLPRVSRGNRPPRRRPR